MEYVLGVAAAALLGTSFVLTGTGAGLAFGVQDALTRRTVDALGGLHQIAAVLANWPVYGWSWPVWPGCG